MFRHVFVAAFAVCLWSPAFAQATGGNGGAGGNATINLYVEPGGNVTVGGQGGGGGNGGAATGSAPSGVASPRSTCWVNDDNPPLNVRNGPNIEPPIANLNNGEIVYKIEEQSFGQNGRWAKVTYHEIYQGWVFRKLIQCD